MPIDNIETRENKEGESTISALPEKLILRGFNGEKEISIKYEGEDKLMKAFISNNIKVYWNSIQINGEDLGINYGPDSQNITFKLGKNPQEVIIEVEEAKDYPGAEKITYQIKGGKIVKVERKRLNNLDVKLYEEEMELLNGSKTPKEVQIGGVGEFYKDNKGRTLIISDEMYSTGPEVMGYGVEEFRSFYISYDGGKTYFEIANSNFGERIKIDETDNEVIYSFINPLSGKKDTFTIKKDSQELAKKEFENSLSSTYIETMLLPTRKKAYEVTLSDGNKILLTKDMNYSYAQHLSLRAYSNGRQINIIDIDEMYGKVILYTDKGVIKLDTDIPKFDGKAIVNIKELN